MPTRVRDENRLLSRRVVSFPRVLPLRLHELLKPSYKPRNSSSNKALSRVMILIIALSITIAAITGFAFLEVHNPNATHTTSTHSTTFSGGIITTTVIQGRTSVITLTSTTTATSHTGSTVTTGKTSTNVVTTSETSTVTTGSTVTSVTNQTSISTTTSSVTSSYSYPIVSTSTVTTTVSETTTPAKDTMVYGSIATTGQGTYPTSIQFKESNGIFWTEVVNGEYSITIPNSATYTVTISWGGAYQWQAGTSASQLALTQGESLLGQNWLIHTPDSSVTVLGSVSTTGAGTHPSHISFSSIHGVYSQNLTNSEFEITLPNMATYNASATWNGAYSWQTGLTSLGQLDLGLNGSSVLLKNWQVLTPNSQVSVSGTVATTGTGTSATNITFYGSAGTSSSGLITNGMYSLTVPNGENYTVTLGWKGAYQWQGGTASYVLNLNQDSGISNVSASWQIPTPNSMITLQGNITSSGDGTHVTKIGLISLENGQSYYAQTNGSNYVLSVPNQAEYSVSTLWTGKYQWQSGNASAGQLSLNALSGTTSSIRNWNVQTPNSEITVAGSIQTSGSGTAATNITFMTSSGEYNSLVQQGQYSVVLPNLAAYNAVINWKGSFNWQNGSTTYGLSVFAGAGVSYLTASWSVPTPNSMITLSGNITCLSGTPYQIEFVSLNGQVNVTASVIGNYYSLVIPNYIDYTVVVNVNNAGVLAPHNVGTFELNATPGVSSVKANWLC